MRIKRRGDVSAEPEVPREEEKKTGSPRKREVSVIVYTTVLFVVALALILLSYKIQQRANNAITNITEQHGEVTAQALRNIEELQKQNLALTQELNEAKDSLEDLRKELEARKGELDDARQEKEALNARLNEQALRMEELEKRAEAASGLLRLVSCEDPEERAGLLEEMSGLAQYLDEAGAEIYHSYIDDMHKENMNKREG